MPALAAMRRKFVDESFSSIAKFINRELVPFLYDLRQRVDGRTIRITESTTMELADEVVIASSASALTYTLLSVERAYRIVRVKNDGAGLLTVAAFAGELVRGASSITLVQGAVAVIVPEVGESAWEVITSYVLDRTQTLTFGATPQTQTVSTAVLAIDWSAGQKHNITLGVNVTSVTFTAPQGTGNFMLLIRQDSTGGRTVAGWPSAVKWGGSSVPVITAAASAIDVVAFYYDGANYWGIISQGFG